MGNGQACGQKHGIDALAVEVVIIISNNEFLGPPNPLCLKAFEPTTEVSILWWMMFYEMFFQSMNSVYEVAG